MQKCLEVKRAIGNIWINMRFSIVLKTIFDIFMEMYQLLKEIINKDVITVD